jgi:hypothetical protein
MKKRKSKYVVNYLPFLKIEKPIKLGSIQFFPYPEQTDMIENSELIPYFERIKNSFWFAKDKSLESITLAKYLPKPWNQLDYDEQEIIWHTNIFLCFCCLATNEFSSDKPYRNSTNFQLFTQYLTVDSDFFSVQTRRRWGTNLTGGYKWGEHIQVIPHYVGRIGETKFDGSFISIFNDISEGKIGPFPELDISLEWFYWANTDSSFSNLDLEAVLMASAFEALFKVPHREKSKRKFLMDSIQNHFKDYKRITTSKPYAQGTSSETRGWKEFWMDEFYCYRNCIAHGNKPNWEGKIWNPLEHLLIAYKIFIDAVRVKFENEIQLKLDIETKANIDTTDEIIKDGKIFEKDWNEIFSKQMWKTTSNKFAGELAKKKAEAKKDRNKSI